MAFAVSTVISGLGLLTAAAGVALNVKSQNDAAKSQAAAARDQEQIAGLQGNNVDVQKQQLALQTDQQHLQIQTQKDVIAQQSQADKIREQASELDATRRRRDAIRQSIVAQSTSLTRATNQGASAPGSSVVQQSRADIAGQADVNLLGISQNLDLGRQLYGINKNITDIYLNSQSQNSSYVDKSQSLQNTVLSTQKQIYALGGDASSNYASAAISGGNAAIGAGLTSAGTAIAGSYPAVNRLTQYFSGGTNTNYAQQLANGEIPV